MPTERELEVLVEQLGSRSFVEREAAERALRAYGESARAALAGARNHASAEIRSRGASLLRQLDVVPLTEAFDALARQPDAKLDLEEGMWLIARIVHRSADRAQLSQQLDALADRVKTRREALQKVGGTDAEVAVQAVCEVLFQEEKFQGNVNDYRNPDNSSLEQVLKTRTGLPILLSHVAIAVGRRADIPLKGVPTPGRYLFKYDNPGTADDLYIDPFAGGKILSRQDRSELFPGVDPDQMVEPQSPREDLIRMLVNLETHLYGRDLSDAAELALRFRIALQEHASQEEN